MRKWAGSQLLAAARGVAGRRRTIGSRFEVRRSRTWGQMGSGLGTASSVSFSRLARWATIAGGCLAIAGCAASNKLSSRIDPKYGVASSPRVVEIGDPVPKGGGVYRLGKPYSVAG